MSEKEYVVVVNKGVDLEEVDAEIAASTGAGSIPNRSVDVANPRAGSKRMTHWMLTDDEAQELMNDTRILSVEIPPDQRDDIKIINNATQRSNFGKTLDNSINTEYVNWGLWRCINETNIYINEFNIGEQDYEYAIDGSNCDIVIQDSGIQADHPEFNNYDNTASRVQQIDWYAESGLAGTMPANHYTDFDGHGTFCAGIAAGKTYGWAKGANIYSQKLQGLEGPSDPNSGLPIADTFDAIRLWHAAKTNGRPTIVNMSWGFVTQISEDVSSGQHYDAAFNAMQNYTPGLGQSGYDDDNGLWTRAGLPPKLFGGGTLRLLPARNPVIDAEVDDLIAAGVHVVIAAGNDYTVAGFNRASPDPWHNFATFPTAGNVFYMRGSSPRSTIGDSTGAQSDSFVVGAIDTIPSNISDKVTQFSTKGEQVNIWAPGAGIHSTLSNTTIYTSAAYPNDSRFNIGNLSGTSFAAPQVAGVCAQYLQSKPHLTPEELVSLITTEAKSVIADRTVNIPVDYNQYSNEALYFAANAMLYSKYGRQPGNITGSISVSNGISVTPR